MFFLLTDAYICLSTLVKYYGGIVTTSGLQNTNGLVKEVPKFSSSTIKPSLLPYKISFSDKTLLKDVFTKYSSPENDKNFKGHIFTRENISNLSMNDFGISTAKIYMSSGEMDFYEISLKKILENFIAKIDPGKKDGLFDRILISAYKALPHVMFPQYDTAIHQLAAVDYESMPWCGFPISVLGLISSKTILGLEIFNNKYDDYIKMDSTKVANKLINNGVSDVKYLYWFFDKIFPSLRKVLHTKPWFERLISVANSFYKQRYFPLIFLMSEGYTFNWEGETPYLIRNYVGTIGNTGINNTNNTIDNLNHYDEKTDYGRDINTNATSSKSSDEEKQMNKLSPYFKTKTQTIKTSSPSYKNSTQSSIHSVSSFSSPPSSTSFDLFTQDFKFDAPQAPKKQAQPKTGSASSGLAGGGSKGQAKVTGLDNIGKEKDAKKPDFGKMIQDFFKTQAGGESACAASGGGESGSGSDSGSSGSAPAYEKPDKEKKQK